MSSVLAAPQLREPLGLGDVVSGSNGHVIILLFFFFASSFIFLKPVALTHILIRLLSAIQVRYEFGYEVNAPEFGNDFAHAERREGGDTSGQYRVLLPDGRIQVVSYTVNGDSGYVAEVSYQWKESELRIAKD